jgi:hypothetical protein
MENRTSFDLNDAIRNWRTKMAESPAYSAKDLDELESHVRDSVEGLARKGLSPEEGFWLAMRRLGNPEALASEFGKVNPEKVWLNRALWMVSGYIIIGILFSVANLLATSFTMCAQVYSREGNFLGPVNFLLANLFWITLLAAFWRTGNSGKSKLWRFADWAKAHPFLIGFGLFLGEMIGLGISVVLTTSLAKSIPITTFGIINKWRYAGSVVPYLLWAVVMTWLLVRKKRLAEIQN